jgi:hypothetical protein
MGKYPSTELSNNDFSACMIPPLTSPQSAFSTDEPPVLRDTSPCRQGVKLNPAGAAREEKKNAEEGRSEYGQEENDRDGKVTEQEKAKAEKDGYSKLGMVTHGYAQVEGTGDEGATEGSENHSQLREGGAPTNQRVAKNGYEGAWRNLNDGVIDDEEEKVVGGEGGTPGERRKRILERSEVPSGSTPEERPDKRRKHNGDEHLNGAATIYSGVPTTDRKKRKDASRVVTMGPGSAPG